MNKALLWEKVVDTIHFENLAQMATCYAICRCWRSIYKADKDGKTRILLGRTGKLIRYVTRGRKCARACNIGKMKMDLNNII